MRATEMTITIMALLTMVTCVGATDPEGIEITRFLPDFKTEDTVKKLEQGLSPAKKLTSKLRVSTDKVWKLIEAYRQEPSTDLENQIYQAVADCGEQIVGNINSIEAQRDRLRDEMRALNSNMTGLKRNLTAYTTSLDGRMGDIVEEAKQLNNELKEAARHLAEHPDDKAKREEFRRKVMALKRLRLKTRLFERNKAMYEKLTGQISKVADFLTQFENQLDAVLESLALQKQVIAMNLMVLRDKAKVIAWLRGESAGRSGVAGIMAQLKDLSGSIQSFGKVMDVMMNLGGDFDNFSEMMPELLDPSLPGNTTVTDEELDSLINEFAKQ